MAHQSCGKNKKKGGYMKYIKKPIPIEAFQYQGDFIENGRYCIPDWAVKAYENGLMFYKSTDDSPSELFIHTLEGEMRCGHMDYILQGVKGKIYPCRKDIFEETYTQIEE